LDFRGDSAIIHKLTECFLSAHTRVGKFPKRDQYTIGKRVEDLLLDMVSLTMLARAKSGRSQLLILEKIDVHVQEFYVLLRIAEKTQSLPTTGYADLSERMIEIGKILGGWIKNAKTVPS
jgi:hypothetical protein